MFEPESRLASLKLDDETKADTGRRRQLGLGQAKLRARRGETAGAWMRPQIAEAYRIGTMPALLPMLPAPEERG